MQKILFLMIMGMIFMPSVNAYECWKGNETTEKQGQYGTMQENGSVPDSIIVPCSEYRAWLAAQPTPTIEYEEKLVVVSETGLDPITQAAISAATGAGAAYLVVRRRKT